MIPPYNDNGYLPAGTHRATLEEIAARIGPDFPRDAAAEAELLAGLPFINLELVDGEGFQQFTERTFATDRNLVPKGMVEVSHEH